MWPRWLLGALARIRNAIRGDPTDAAAVQATAQTFPTLPPQQQAQIASAAAQQAQIVRLANESDDDAPFVNIGPDDLVLAPLDWINVAVRFEGPNGAVRWRTFQIAYEPGMTTGDARRMAEEMASLERDRYPGWHVSRSVFM